MNTITRRRILAALAGTLPFAATVGTATGRSAADGRPLRIVGPSQVQSRALASSGFFLRSHEETPYAWAGEICAALRKNNVPHQCFTYPGAGHTFQGENYDNLMRRARGFFDRALRNGE